MSTLGGVVEWCGNFFSMLPEILPGEEVLSKSLQQEFLEASGSFLLLHGDFLVVGDRRKFLVDSRPSLWIPGSFWLVAVISWMGKDE